VEVVQCLTELGLNVKKARISSDGGWFVDEFHVTEANGRKVTNTLKIDTIRAVLNVEYEHDAGEQAVSADGSTGNGLTTVHGLGAGSSASSSRLQQLDQETNQSSTVFELAGQDRIGLLADVLSLLTDNGCDVRSAAVWTYNKRVAVVVAVVQNGLPVREPAKLRRLKELLHQKMDPCGNSIVNVTPFVKGHVHYERRLHQLMLKEEEKQWQRDKEQHLMAAGVPLQQPCTGDCSSAASSISSNSRCNGSCTSAGALSSQAAAAGGRVVPPKAPGMNGYAQVNGFGGQADQWQQQQSQQLQRQQLTCQPSGARNQGEVHMVTSGPAQLPDGQLATMISPKYSKPEVTIQHYAHLSYWMVTIKCKDRNKLFFDTVCTLSDLDYDVYHGAIDSDGALATQLYYIRPRYGDSTWDARKAVKLRVMLEAAIQRRFPKGLKVHIQQSSQHCLTDITVAWKNAGLWITRAKVRAYAENGHTLYVMDSNGHPPDPHKVQDACMLSGGRPQQGWDGTLINSSPPLQQPAPAVKGQGPDMAAAAAVAAAAAAAAAAEASGLPQGAGQGAKFFYAFLQRNWDGSPSSIPSV
jgi:hypothetical protein